MKKSGKSLKTSKPKEVKISKGRKIKKNIRVNSKEGKEILINESVEKENERLDKNILDVLGFS